MTRDPQRAGETFAEFLARLRAEQAARGVPTPKPLTDETPPKPWNECDPEPEEENT